MQKARDHALFVEAGALGEIQHVDPVELMVLAGVDQPQNRVGDRRVGGLLEHGKLGLDVAHAGSLNEAAETRAQDLSVSGAQYETSASDRAASSPRRPA